MIAADNAGLIWYCRWGFEIEKGDKGRISASKVEELIR